MGVARSVTQWFLKGSALPAVAIFAGWLRLDRIFDTMWRWARRGRVRRMTPLEIHEAERVFGNKIPYEDVRIVEVSALAQRIVRLSGRVHLEQSERLGVTLFNTIHFSTALRAENQDMPWLIHELTHVWQYNQAGPRYLADSLQAQAAHGHEAYNIEHGLAEGWSWDDFNLEQQGDIARAYYKALVAGEDTNRFQAHLGVLQGVRMTV